MTTSRVHIEISKALTEAIDVLKESYKGSSLTDIFFVIGKEDAELSIFDDEENLLAQRIIDAWIGLDNDKLITQQLKDVTEQFAAENKFDALDLYKPFSINISDDEFIVQEELLAIEDESLVTLDDEFLSRMDKEFDDFLDRLLKE